MTCNLVNKRGIPVLVYPASDAASQWLCSLVVKHSEARMQATISLQSSIPIHGFDDEQTFTLVYDADNLVPGKTSLERATIALPQARQREITRQGSPKLKTLSLTLAKPCSVWCPPSSGCIGPKLGFDSPFHQLVKLARATEIHILLDYNWFHRDKQSRFERLVSYPQELTGFTVDNYANRFRQADWSVFSPVEDAASEALPSYAEVSERCSREGANKRPRQASLNSTPERPCPKRILFSPAPIYAPSPTEKATTASTPSPKPVHYTPSPTEKATTAATSSPRPLHSPVTHAPDIHEAIKSAVETMLPDVLREILPNMLPHLLGTPFSSPSSSPSPNRSVNRNRKPTTTSSLRTLISTRAAAHAEAQLQKIYDETVDHAADLRNTADVDFHEFLEEQKFDVTMVKDDSVAELNRMFDEKVEEFKDSTAEILEGVEERAEMVFIDACDRLDSLLDRERAFLRRERELLECDKRSFEEKQRIAWQNTCGDRGRRAVSLPF